MQISKQPQNDPESKLNSYKNNAKPKCTFENWPHLETKWSNASQQHIVTRPETRKKASRRLEFLA